MAKGGRGQGGPASPTPGGGGGPDPQKADEAKGKMAALSEGLGALRGSVGMVTGAFMAIPDAARSFVAAFAPQTVERLDLAFESLSGTIGYALEPIIQATTEIVNRFAGSLMEGLDMLREPIANVAGLFMEVLEPLIKFWGDALARMAKGVQAIMPLFKQLAGVLQAVTLLYTTFWTVFGELIVPLFMAIVEPLTKAGGVFDFLTGVMLKLAETVLQVTGFFLALIGKEELFVNILAALVGKRPDRGRDLMPRDFGTTSLDALYQKRLVAAAAAAGGPSLPQQQLDSQKRLEELVKLMLEELKKRPGASQEARKAAAKALEKLEEDERQNRRNSP